MAKKAKAPNPFAGRWRIVSMNAWEEKFIDEEEEGCFEFDQKGTASFASDTFTASWIAA